MMRKTMVMALFLSSVLLARADVASAVETAKRIGLAYNQLGVVVTVANPTDVTAVKVVLKDGQGVAVQQQRAVLSGGSATVSFADLTPGTSYSYDVVLLMDEAEVEPVGWKTVPADLFEAVNWFGFISGAFQKATPDTNIEIEDQTFVSKGDALGVVTPTADPVDGRMTVTETRVEVMGAYAWDELPSLENSQVAVGLALKKNATEDSPANRVWAYKAGSGDWTALTSCEAPVGNGTYVLRTVMDYRANHKVASCTLTAGTETYTLFADVPLTADQMNRVGVFGGSVVRQNAGYPRLTAPVEVGPTGTEISLESSTEVDLAKLTAGTPYTVTGNGYALCWTDAANRYATKVGNTLTAHEGAPANGMESFASYALGLDPTDKLDKPAAIVKPGGIQSADGITVHVPNVTAANLPDSGVQVLFQRQKSTDGGTTWVDDGEPVAVGSDIAIPFTQGTLYRVNTILK